MVDPISGYPFEGWNQDPKKGLYLRSFTQLTAIGQYMELLANIAAGMCDTPYLSRKQALANLAHLVKNLRQDQHDPRLSAENLLGNFLDLATGKRLGPLAVDVEKHKFQDAFGKEKGEAIWRALQAKGWIVPRNGDQRSRHPAIRDVRLGPFRRSPGPLRGQRHEAEDHGHPRPARGHDRVHRQRQPVDGRGEDDRCAPPAADQGPGGGPGAAPGAGALPRRAARGIRAAL